MHQYTSHTMNLRDEQIWMLVLLAVAVLIVILNDRTKERAVRQAERKGQRPPRKYLNYKTSWRLVLAFVLLIVAAMFIGNWKLPQVSPVILYGIPVAATALFIVFVVILQRKNRVHVTAVRMAQQGDVDGAIALLHKHMEQHGPSAMSFNSLAALLAMQGKWAESLALIEQAEQHGGSKALYLGNKGLALWKLGRLEDALPCLKEAAMGSWASLLTICNYGSILAELGMHNEALAQLRRADQLFAQRGRFMARLDRRVCEQALEKFRTLVSSRPLK